MSTPSAGPVHPFAHVGTTVADLERARAFWADAFGATVTEPVTVDGPEPGRVVGHPGVTLRVAFADVPGGPRIELLEYHGDYPGAGEHDPLPEANAHPGNYHLAVYAADIDAAWRRALEAGARPVSDGPVTMPLGADPGRQVAYLRTPDGHTVELVRPSSGVLPSA